MKTQNVTKKAFMIIFSLLMVMSSISLANIKAGTVSEPTPVLTNAEYSSDYYAEGIAIYPFRNTAVGTHASFIGGTVELPFDLTSYTNLQAFSFVVSNQLLWRQFAPRRLWDVSDGATLLLVFRGVVDNALDNGNEIKALIETAYNVSLTLVFGEWHNAEQITLLIFQGRMGSAQVNEFTGDFVNYVSDEGLGAGITESTLVSAPLKAMSISLYRGPVFRAIIPAEVRLLYPFIGLSLAFVPVVEVGWINPTGLVKTDTIIEMNLTNIMPDLPVVEATSITDVAFVSMSLPYVVDVLVVDPETDNMYSHLKGQFDWAIRLNIPLWNINITNSYSDIYVKYDLNLTGLTQYPQVVGEMSVNTTELFGGGDDVIYSFTWENIGTETAFDLNLAYGDFDLTQIDGMPFLVNNEDLTFYPSKVMYYNSTSEMLTDTPVAGDDIVVVTGWFFNESSGLWLLNNQIVTQEDIDNMDQIIYKEEYFLQLDPMDFDIEETYFDNGTSTGHGTLKATEADLAVGENITKQFAIRNIPHGTFTSYAVDDTTPNEIHVSIDNTVNWQDVVIVFLRLLGSSLHFPEDQPSLFNLRPEPVTGAAYFYNDADGKEYLGMTNGLVIQVYDDEAILIGKISLDKPFYRFNEEVTFTLELTNIGNVDATDISYQMFHGFVDEDYNLNYVQAIPDTIGYIDNIEAGETVVVNETTLANAEVGLHPVFAIFGYTSNETDDPNYNIFDACEHPAVLSSMDFGIVLPPLNKEGTTEPTYPTPEVEVTTEVIGYVENETKVGDTITLRVTIENVGDEPTNIIYIQRLPRRLNYVDNTLSITIDEAEVEDYTITYRPYQPDITKPGFNPFMNIVMIFDSYENQQPVGIPLGVNETLVIQADFKIARSNTVEYTDWNIIDEINNRIGFYIPPAEVRYNSNYQMLRTTGINDETEAPEEDTSSVSSALSYSNTFPVASINDEPIISDPQATTNSWGSYSDSLSLVINELLGLKLNYLYIGIGTIAVTSVAIIIYFTANGKRK
ncbi:MAG: hypothetical protein FK734_20540 [Asgard group archaeon]|nr:hypothetical protein [Asgard group archaeon]